MRPAALPEQIPATPEELEQVLLRETARALAEAHNLLDRSRSRTTRVETLKSQAASDQNKLVAAQSQRIRSLEQQVSDLQAFGVSQSAALDEAIALVTELEQRMGVLERVNIELQRHVERPTAAPRHHRREASRFDHELDLIRRSGAGSDPTRFSEFARLAGAA